jgi:hypothetical protein
MRNGLAAVVIMLAALALSASGPDVLTATGGLPFDIAGIFKEPSAFEQLRSGQYLVFDRRAHAVFGVDARQTTAWKLVDIGQEPGRLLDPTAFDAEPGGSFAVADAPEGRERVQLFSESGRRLGGFMLPGRAEPRVTLGSQVVSGVGSLQFTGQAILMSQPETGALITEFGLGGTPTRSIGTLRPTGREAEPDLHLALNSGLVLATPGGGFYFVFRAGIPAFRKYDAQGRLVFERHIEGVDLDPAVAALPTAWPRRGRPDGGRDLPLVTALVRTAAVDPGGNLWVSLVTRTTYVYDLDGARTRVVQFRGAGIIEPSSLSFPGQERVLVTPGCYEFRAGR